ncbi:hypothetical protein [uncultured Alteromonas sp.]|jgi:serine/threonine protein phosphatase PrpC|uniref:hypothetical protein n=1 Tax=uncultured Alteromonas sp. TaxID=179113 RepID=UPI0025EB99F4|nr:hypothetical protein [uncultured Alteromonas sp.]
MDSSKLINITCHSQQGEEREINRDFINIFEFNSGILIYLIDISTNSKLDGIDFTAKINTLIKSKISLKSLVDGKEFGSSFHEIVSELKTQFTVGVASLLIAYIPYESNLIWGYTIGDARMGFMAEGDVTWETPVHTGANPFGEIFTETMKSSPHRHILTRSLNMRKKYQPEFFQFSLINKNLIILGSDGFWAELTNENQHSFLAGNDIASRDDCSVAIIDIPETKRGVTMALQSEQTKYFDLTI